MMHLLVIYAILSVFAVTIESSSQSDDVSKKVKSFNEYETYSCGDVNENPREVLLLHNNGDIGKIDQKRHYFYRTKWMTLKTLVP
jgi:hypothetical protein